MRLEEAGASLAQRYATMVDGGVLSRDPAQAALAARFDALNRALAARPPAPKAGVIGRLFARKSPPPPRGLYIHGEVGRGKTMLMDEFFAVAAVEARRRVHFNEFMGEVHERVHALRQAEKAGDPIAPVAADIARETRLLCLDEFQVTDIADAMILARLFGGLFAEGLVLVATSNVAPQDLYRDGLNRGLFLPFIPLLEKHVDVMRLDAATDYRLGKLSGIPVYVTPPGPAATAALDRLWQSLTGAPRGERLVLRNKGRDIVVPQALRGVARFTFSDLCEAPLGAGDYEKIARACHTVIVDNIPVIDDDRRDVARRLILLIDTLYDHRVKLIASAAAEPGGLYRAAYGEEAHAFRRTVSRLMEMRSAAYLGEAHGAATTPSAG
jgi:cell division protein ZapE